MMAMSVGTGDWLLVTSVGMLIVSISVLAWAETAIGRTSRARAAAMVDQLQQAVDRRGLAWQIQAQQVRQLTEGNYHGGAEGEPQHH